MKFYETGIPCVDVPLGGGIMEGQTTFLAGRPGVGKTAIATKIAGSMAKRGIGVLYCNIENSQVTTEYITAINDLVPDAGDELLIDEYCPVRVHFPDLHDLIGEIYMSDWANVVIVDYIQLMHGAIKDLDTVFKKVFPNKALLCLTQLPRPKISPMIRRQTAKDLSRDIGFVPDASIILYRESYYDHSVPNSMEVTVYEGNCGILRSCIPWTPDEYTDPFCKKINSNEEEENNEP